MNALKKVRRAPVPTQPYPAPPNEPAPTHKVCLQVLNESGWDYDEKLFRELPSTMIPRIGETIIAHYPAIGERCKARLVQVKVVDVKHCCYGGTFWHTNVIGELVTE